MLFGDRKPSFRLLIPFLLQNVHTSPRNMLITRFSTVDRACSCMYIYMADASQRTSFLVKNIYEGLYGEYFMREKADV